MTTNFKTLSQREDIYFLFFRDGAFHRGEDEQMPPYIADHYVTKMKEWLAHQQIIYDKELTQYRASLSKEALQVQAAVPVSVAGDGPQGKKSPSAIIETLLPANEVGQTPGVYILIDERWVEYKKDGSYAKERAYNLDEMLFSLKLCARDFKVKLAFIGCQARMEILVFDEKEPRYDCIEMIEKKAHVIEIVHTIVWEHVKFELKFK